MSEQHKPLTAAEIEELKDALQGADDLLCIAFKFGIQEPEEGSIGGKIRHALRDTIPRLFSILTPPTDAALREAVERCEAHIRAHTGHVYSLGEAIATLLRAVQAPRLTGEQVELVNSELAKQLKAQDFALEHILEALDIDPEETRIDIKSGESVVASVSIAELHSRSRAALAEYEEART